MVTILVEVIDLRGGRCAIAELGCDKTAELSNPSKVGNDAISVKSTLELG